MSDDLYNDAEEQAKLVTPQAARRNPKVFIVCAVALTLLVMAFIISRVAGVVSAKQLRANTPLVETMTKQDSDTFAMQQRAQSQFLKQTDRTKATAADAETVLGQASNLQGDAFSEVDGIPRRTKAQDAAMNGAPYSGGAVSEAEQRAEKARLEAQNRAKNDLDSSPVAIDYSDFFAKEKEASRAAAETAAPLAAISTSQPVAKAEWPLEAVTMKGEANEELINPPIETSQPEPREEYVFDSAHGKQYRLMEDTVIETVLVNRLAGAAVGPVITMVTTDVYSHSGQHLLIPKGTRLLGSVTAVSGRDQERLFVAFHRMIEPDGYSVSLDKFKGLDVVGQTGLRDLVNHHYTQIFGASLALAAVAATTQVGAASSFATYDFGASMRSGASQGFGQAAEQVMTRFLNILPTFTIREKTRVKVMLANDLLLYDVKNHTMDPDL